MNLVTLEVVCCGAATLGHGVLDCGLQILFDDVRSGLILALGHIILDSHQFGILRSERHRPHGHEHLQFGPIHEAARA